MKFYDSVNKAGIVDDVFFITGTDAVSYPLADIARNANRHQNKAVIDILKTEGRVQFDDSNNSGLPESTFDLANGQSQYSLPTNLLKLWAIEIVDTAGNNIRLEEIDINDPMMSKTITDFQDTPGVPKYYDVRGENVFLYPAPATGSVTLTTGGKMFFVRETDPLTAADTTQEPCIPEPFHRILSVGCSMDYFMVNDLSKVDKWRGEYEQLRSELRQFSSTRNKEVIPRLIPNHNQNSYL